MTIESASVNLCNQRSYWYSPPFSYLAPCSLPASLLLHLAISVPKKSHGTTSQSTLHYPFFPLIIISLSLGSPLLLPLRLSVCLAPWCAAKPWVPEQWALLCYRGGNRTHALTHTHSRRSECVCKYTRMLIHTCKHKFWLARV